MSRGETASGGTLTLAAPCDLSAGDIIKSILVEISKRYPQKSMCWRQNVVVGRLKNRGDDSVRHVRSCPNGTADILGTIMGVPMAIEVKALGDRARTAQKDWKSAWEKAGGVYIVARDVDRAMDEVCCAVGRVGQRVVGL